MVKNVIYNVPLFLCIKISQNLFPLRKAVREPSIVTQEKDTPWKRQAECQCIFYYNLFLIIIKQLLLYLSQFTFTW